MAQTADVLTQTAQVATNSMLPTTATSDPSLLLARRRCIRLGQAAPYSNRRLDVVRNALHGQRRECEREPARPGIRPLQQDAIQETNIATSGIWAKYGRFGGGVVNVIAQVGGDVFSGSFRESLNNDKWRTLTP